MFEFLSNVYHFFGLPEMLVNHMTFLPDYMKEAIVSVIVFIPWLYFLYYVIELIERFFLTHINTFLKLLKDMGPVFAGLVSIIPESGYSVMASTFYSRKMITRGTLLAFYIVCSDDALPLLFMNMSKTAIIIPLIIIKLVVGILAAITVDLIFIQKEQLKENDQANTQLNVEGCCAHRLTTDPNPPYWWTHPISHTFNMFMFTLILLVIIEFCIHSVGGAENLSQLIFKGSPLQVIIGAGLGLIPNSIISIFFALAYIKSLVGFPTFVAGMISVSGLGLATLKRYYKNNTKDYNLIRWLLFGIATGVGLLIHYNMMFIQVFKDAIG